MMLSPTRPPERFSHISQTQLSIARYYGGCRWNGAEYIYVPQTDELVRADVLKREQQAQAHAQRETQQHLDARQGVLF